MTPDMNRLCLAAWCADSGASPEAFAHRSEEDEARTERVVRAVLMALRELSAAVKEAAEKGTEFYGAGENISYDAGETIARAVDFVLAEPATA